MISFVESNMNVEKIAKDRTLCCGCNACETVCPVNAIQMIPDKCGNQYPHIDSEKCIDCSLCSKVCCENNKVPQRMPQNVIAASYRNTELSKKSSSGGLFPAIAEYILQGNGIVYGTCFDNGFHPVVVGIDSINDLERLQGSKYVRSNMGDVYKDIQDQLKAGRKVLFTGVPCQVAAVKQFLQKDYENLVTVDIVCHGTPSSKMFHDYLNYIEQKHKIEIVDFQFRDKDVRQDTNGKVVYKQNHLGKVVYKQNHLKSYQSSYYKLFLSCLTFREGCYYCKFAAPERVGDISICDYWGADEEEPDFNRRIKEEGLTGISAVMINTETGSRVIAAIADQLLQKDTKYESVRKNNPQLNRPSILTKEHKYVMKLFADSGYEAVDKYYHSHYRTKIMISTVGQILPDNTKKNLVKLKRKIKK